MALMFPFSTPVFLYPLMMSPDYHGYFDAMVCFYNFYWNGEKADIKQTWLTNTEKLNFTG